ncbi:hypothetical protein BpHYR1_007853 [Brachionus plicatilis]|uniref:Uncharacterized protein n=1 Tax=Brachionus plicatilis TaxID=10195 RepID=A0A3M7SX11_BRAPC|nr:hypothetical protein BpHYR1_007853 [Brachionus plicatilis]
MLEVGVCQDKILVYVSKVVGGEKALAYLHVTRGDAHHLILLLVRLDAKQALEFCVDHFFVCHISKTARTKSAGLVDPRCTSRSHQRNRSRRLNSHGEPTLPHFFSTHTSWFISELNWIILDNWSRSIAYIDWQMCSKSSWLILST